MASLEAQSLTEKMRSARKGGVVALQRLNSLRSSCPDETVLALEGGDDVVFYQVMIGKVRPDLKWLPLVCRGKDSVLELSDLVERNLESEKSITFFAVDNDYDGMKGRGFRDNVYVTPSYSIENLLFSNSIIESLLLAEYHCYDSLECKNNVLSLYKKLKIDYISSVTLPNKIIYYCRLNNLNKLSIVDNLKALVDISLSGVRAKYDEVSIYEILSVSGFVSDEDLVAQEKEFAGLDPDLEWRGKFHLQFLKEFLRLLKDDRMLESPEHFKERRKVSFDPYQSIIRTLSSICSVPESLKTFVSRMA